jgi:hypothetical protein
VSDTWLKLIPTDPEYVPDKLAQEKARNALALLLPNAEEVNGEATTGVKFIDQGENFDKVLCPICETELSMKWWEGAMNKACGANTRKRLDAVFEETWEEGGPTFSNLITKVPCCGAELSLNDLNYVWPAGFALFSLEALYPDRDLEDWELTWLERLVGCKLRKIWALY